MTKRWTYTLATTTGALTLALSGAVNAQDATGDADPELGATEAGSVELGASGSASSSGSASGSAAGAGGYQASDRGDYSGGDAGGSDGVRLALQLRLDAINLIAMAEPDGLDNGPLPSRQLLVPVATLGVRLLDEGALFLGLGLGFANASSDNGPNEQSQTGFSLTPLVTYDLIAESDSALSLLALVDLASLGETEQCNAAGACMDQNDDAFGIGLGVGVGLRGKLSPAVALGGELGWGFLSVDRNGDDSDFVHGIFGNLLLEASVGL